MATKKAAAKRAGTKRSAGGRSSTGSPRPPLLYANASPRSVGGTSMFAATRLPTTATFLQYASDEAVIRSAVARLQAAGFSVLSISPFTINVAAPPEVYEDVFGVELFTEEREVIKGGAVRDTATFVDCAATDLPGLIDTAGSPLADVLEGVAIEEPVYLMASAFAPTREYWHLRMPGDVAAATSAEKAHRRGYTGKGVSVVMVDSGWYRHPYFTRRGYRSAPVVLGPGASAPDADESGHGTGESANVFAIAPDVDFTMVKLSFVNSTGGFNAAVALAPDIISCSWGSSIQHGPLSAANIALATAVANAWANGIVVVFSAGNGHWGFPGQHPDVISAGGAFMDVDESLEASDYASGFASNLYPGRNVPDLSGLVGMQPGASYLMLPVEPGDDIDDGRAGGSHPPQDETADDDGWAAFSGTSAAAPQLAGVAALMKQACGRLTPDQVRSMMMATATDVTAGSNSHGNAAGTGYDLATGAGLVDADRAVLRARLACLTIRPPIRPVSVAPPIQPVAPVTPVQPPIRPIQPPIVPVQPIRPPVGPITPVQPIRPPVAPIAPVQPIQPPISPIRPPIGPVVTGGGHDPAAQQADAEAALRAQVEAMLAAGYAPEEVDRWLEQVLGGQDPGPAQGITPEEAAALEQAILDGEDLDL